MHRGLTGIVDAGLVETSKIFVRNNLEIAVAPGDPKHITGLAELEKSCVSLALEDASAPARKDTHRSACRASRVE